MKRRIFSLLMGLIMIMSVLPVNVVAAGAEAPTTNGAYTDGEWDVSDNGSVTYNVGENDTPVTLSKTASAVDGMENTFDITLKVETSTVTTQRTDGGAVVLVIDVSGSMDYCANCGGDGSHKNSCEYNGRVTSAQSRMTATKTAAQSFLQAYAGTDSSANRQIALVKFSTTGSPVNFGSRWGRSVYWVNVAGGANGSNAANYTRVVNAINGLNADGGTNLDDGLYEAYNLLDDVNAIDKNVIALTDGVPTFRGHTSNPSGSGSGGSAQNNSAAAAQATNIKNTGAKLYTVCFGVANERTYNGGPTVGNFLSGSVASSGCAYNADNTAELNNAFKAITENITSGLSGQGWTATDPMADKIDLVSGASSSFVAGDNETYTWTLSDPVVGEEDENGVTTYTYTYTYRVELNDQSVGFEEGTYYPTNKETYLTIEGQQYAFPVPGVQGVLPRTDVSVTKIWEDADNQDGIRSESVTVQLMEGEAKIGEPVELNDANKWTYTWDGETYNLIAMTEGKSHIYTVEEVAVDGYDISVENGTSENGYAITLTNTHEIEKKDIVVTKTWNDNDDQDGKRPGSITVNLLADGEVVETKTVTETDGWTCTFEGYPVYKAGAVGDEIEYTVTEDSVDGYTTTINGLVITNTHEIEKTEVSVTKVWEDADNQDGIRPQDITVTLLADGEDTGKTLTLNKGNNWADSFTDLDKYSAGQEVAYIVDEISVPGYETVITGDQATGYTITNTHTPAVVSVAGSKTWTDNNDQDGFRPETITINLLADGEVIDTIEVTEADNWAWNFENLPQYKNEGAEIVYAITEDAVEDYSTTYNGYNVINTHTPEQTSVTVTKSWQDADNQDGIRAEDVTVTLLADGEDTGKTLILNDGNNWTGSFTELDKFADGEEITYTVDEISVPGYETVITGDQATGYTITNTHTPAVVSVAGSKTWTDNNDQDGFRPETITINLLADGEVIDTIEVTEADNWAWNFENLPQYKNEGVEIIYAITEEAVEDYSTTYNGYNVINTHTPEQTSVTVTKSWQDNDDQDGLRPNSITVALLADGEDTGKALILNDGNNWTGSFTELDKYADGQVIAYTVAELTVADYNTVITGDQATGYTITNSHTPEVTTVSGSKTWTDNNDQDGKRPEAITINLLKNGEVIDTQDVTEEDGWAWSFTNLPVYENHGTSINYSISEVAVDQYTTTYNGYNVINTHAPEKTSVTVAKSWQDNNDQDGIRPNDITVVLVANGEATENTLLLSDGNNWTGSFTDLDKYANGLEIAYTVQELEIDGYNSVITGDQATGYTITNSHTPEVTTVSGSKTWDDNDNQDGKRPESITINLLKNGEVFDTKIVTEADGWAWSFDNLAVYENHGNEINYSITEVAVDQYTTTYNGYNVINTHAPEKTSVTVAKSWQDNNDQDGIRPDAITVVLVANGEATENTLELNADNNWTGSFTDLDKYAAGEEVAYTVEEIAVEGYETVITGTQTDGYTITNSHTPEVTTVSGSKTWNDNNNQDGKRPESITINLIKNGEVFDTKTVTEADGWAWNFENLPVYENGGSEIIYSVTEKAVEGYTTTYTADTFDIVNSYAPEKTSITVTKAWKDSNDADGIRPDAVTIKLLANGVDTGKTLKLTADTNWTGSFSELDKYADGKAIEYTVAEVSIKGYNTVITGTAAEGFTVTNSHSVSPKTGDHMDSMLWLMVMLGSAAAFVATALYTKKRYAQ